MILGYHCKISVKWVARLAIRAQRCMVIQVFCRFFPDLFAGAAIYSKQEKDHFVMRSSLFLVSALLCFCACSQAEPYWDSVDKVLTESHITNQPFQDFLTALTQDLLEKKHMSEIERLMNQMITSVDPDYLESFLNRPHQMASEMTQNEVLKSNRIANTIAIIAIGRLAQLSVCIEFEKQRLLHRTKSKKDIYDDIWSPAMYIVERNVFFPLYGEYVDVAFKSQLASCSSGELVSLLDNYNSAQQHPDENAMKLRAWARHFKKFPLDNSAEREVLIKNIEKDYEKYAKNQTSYGQIFMQSTIILYYKNASDEQIALFRERMLKYSKMHNLIFSVFFLTRDIDSFRKSDINIKFRSL